MTEKKRDYRRPRIVRLAAEPSGRGNCTSGSGDVNYCVDGSSAGTDCATGNSANWHCLSSGNTPSIT